MQGTAKCYKVKLGCDCGSDGASVVCTTFVMQDPNGSSYTASLCQGMDPTSRNYVGDPFLCIANGENPFTADGTTPIAIVVTPDPGGQPGTPGTGVTGTMTSLPDGTLFICVPNFLLNDPRIPLVEN